MDLSSSVAALLAGGEAQVADPWPIWRALREAGPVVEVADVHWVTTHDTVREVLKTDDRFLSGARGGGSRDARLRSQMTAEQRVAYDEEVAFEGLFIVATDGAQHARIRRIAQRTFTPRRISHLDAATRRYVDEHLAHGDRGVVDMMQFAYRIPLMIIGELLGVPTGDREMIKEWSTTWFEYRHQPDDRIFISAQARRDFCAYVDDMIAEHRRVGGDGLIGELIDAERDDRLSTDELAALYFILLFAGHETTTNLIGTGLYELLRHREQWRALCDDPELIPGAVEELLRHVSPVQWLQRHVDHDIEIAGATIPAGATIYPSLAAANRDPAVFDEPDRLDISRPNAADHLGLGFGAHYCLGAALARLEASVALRALVTDHPDMELVTDDVGWRGAAMLRGLAGLPVRLGASRSGG